MHGGAGSAPRRARRGRPDRLLGSQRHRLLRLPFRRLAARRRQRRRQLAPVPGGDGRDHRRCRAHRCWRSTRITSPRWQGCRAPCPRCEPSSSSATMQTRVPTHACGDVRAVGGRVLGGGPGPRRRSQRGQHAALHVGHHRVAQGSDAHQRKPVHRRGRRGRDVQHHRRHGEPRSHAPLPHRGFGLGAMRHVAGRTVHHRARRRSRRVARPDRDGAHHRDVPRARRPHALAGDALADLHGSLERASHLLWGVAHLRGRARQVHGGLRMRVLPGLRDDGDDRRHHRVALRGSRPRRPAARSAPLGRQASPARGVADRRPVNRRRRADGCSRGGVDALALQHGGLLGQGLRDRGDDRRRRLAAHRRCRLLRRRGVPLSPRQDQGHGRERRGERLPGGGRERPPRPPGHRRRGRHRGARRTVGRNREGHRRAGARAGARRGRRHRALS